MRELEGDRTAILCVCYKFCNHTTDILPENMQKEVIISEI